MTKRYFVTAAGLQAAFADTAVATGLVAVLRGEATPAVRAKLEEQGYIVEERRHEAHIDHNLIVLSGALDRLRELVGSHDGARSDGAGHNNQHTVQDLRTMPRKLYRLKGALTDAELRKLPSGARHVYAALQRLDVGTVRSLAEATGLNRRTVENGVSALRRTDVLEDVPLPRETH